MSELKLVSPLLDGFEMGDPISDRNGVRCCPAMKENSDDKYIVKIISVPASQKQLDALLFSKAYRNAEAAAEYFKDLAEDTVKEARLLQQLSKLEGFLPYEGWQIVPMDKNETGYDIYLLGGYKRSLDKFLSRNPMTHLGAVNLGIDLCTALSLCRRAGFIYTDLKPGNIFITEQREYRIGDLGFAKLNAMKYTSINANYISRFTPPEMHDPLATLNPTVDTYAVGMILYMIYNNGHIPFETKAPMMILPAPLNADYEMAEIILKACDPNPRKRYQTPVEMGKALVSYMQRNCVNDVPIVPPSMSINPTQAAEPEQAASEEIPVEATPAAVPVAESITPEADELDFLNDLVSDETAPDADVHEDHADAQLTEEVDMMLAQADELLQFESDIDAEPDEIAQDLSEEDAVAAEAAAEEDDVLDILFADEVTSLEEEAAVEEDIPVAVEAPVEDVESITEDSETEISLTEDESDDLDFALDFSSDMGIDAEEVEAADADLEFGLPTGEAIPVISDTDEDFFTDTKPRKKKSGWIGLIIFLLILALLGGGAYYYYTNHYLLEISNMQIEGYEDSLSINLTTDADETLLRVVCTDIYGNKQEQPVVGGYVVFTNLNPDSMYKISVVADGFHKLTGSTSGSYTTAAATTIVDFSAKGGMEDGSVILNFTVDGPETQQWSVEYSAEGEQTKSVSFTGHMVTISDLTIDKRYTFTLVPDPSASLYLDGKTSLEYAASKVVVAEKLAIVSCVDGVLTAEWKLPEGTSADSWIVRCYSESDFDETITVSDTTAQFSNITTDSAYTVEVTAEGMSQSARAFVTANPATVTDVQVAYAVETGMTITWSCESAPAGGWLVMYSIDGSETTEMIQCSNTSAVIKNVIPNAAYSFQIMAADGSTVFGGNAEHAGIEARTFDSYGLTASQIQSSLCHSPDKEGWTHEDVEETAYTTAYAPGERASLVLYTSARFYLKTDETTVMFVIRDAEGKVIPNLVRTKTSSWRDLWPGVGKYCYLDVPVMPSEFGEYTLEVYFNGATALTKNFSIISDIG